MSDGKLPLSRRQALIVGAAGGAGALATVAEALDSDGDTGTLYGGTMALSQAFKIADGIWVGPDSAKSNVAADSGNLYLASNTDVDYYGDGGNWVLRNVGSASKSVPEIHSQSHVTEVASITGEQVLLYDDSTGLFDNYLISDFADIGAAINQAITDASLGPTIILPSGRFSKTTTINLVSGTTLIGQGKWPSNEGTRLNHTDSTSHNIDVNGNRRVSIRDVLLLGPGSGTSSDGIVADVDAVEIERVHVQDHRRGLDARGDYSTYLRLRNSRFHQCNNGAEVEMGDGEIISCRFSSNDNHGLHVLATKGSTILGGSSEGNGSFGIRCDDTGQAGQVLKALDVIGHWFEGNNSAFAWDPTNTTGEAGRFVGNYMNNAGANASAIGVEIGDSQEFYVAHNRIQNYDDAIQVRVAATDLHLGPNFFDSNTTNIAPGGTRQRYKHIIAGGPFGGTDIGSLTGASEGDIARADGTNASATADELFILKSSGDWQSIADPTTTITPS